MQGKVEEIRSLKKLIFCYFIRKAGLVYLVWNFRPSSDPESAMVQKISVFFRKLKFISRKFPFVLRFQYKLNLGGCSQRIFLCCRLLELSGSFLLLWCLLESLDFSRLQLVDHLFVDVDSGVDVAEGITRHVLLLGDF